MGFKADRAISPTSKLIINFLKERTTPQSAIAISDEVGATYWTACALCKDLTSMGLLTLTLVGKSPFYSLAIANEVKQ
jgi:hypothetical protein